MSLSSSPLIRWYVAFFAGTGLLLGVTTGAVAWSDAPADARSAGARLVRVDAGEVSAVPTDEGPADAPTDGPTDAPTNAPTNALGAAADAPTPPDALPDADQAEPEEATDEAPRPPAERGVTRWEARETSDCRVRANRVVPARRIRRREPIDTEGPFLADGYPIFLFVDLMNRTGRSQRVYVQWVHEASGYVIRDLVNASPSWGWRTSSAQALPLGKLGTWTVELLDADRCLVDAVDLELRAPSW